MSITSKTLSPQQRTELRVRRAKKILDTIFEDSEAPPSDTLRALMAVSNYAQELKGALR